MASLERLREVNPITLPRVPGHVRISPCLGQVGKFICIGLNYPDHTAETGVSVSEEPVIFSKATSAISGPFDDVELPPGSSKTDREVELVVVIGAHARCVSEAQVLEFVLMDELLLPNRNTRFLRPAAHFST